MSNFTLDSNNFSEQLGIYDFFNVVLNGAVFVSGISLINSNAYDKLCENISFFKGIVLILVIYTIGMIIQELGSLVDKKILNIYRSMSNSLLKPHFRYEKTASNGIVEVPKNKPCKRNNRQISDNTKISAKQGNAEGRPDAGCEIKRWEAAAEMSSFFNIPPDISKADKPQGFGDRVPDSR